MRLVKMYYDTHASASVRCEVPDSITDPWDVEEYVRSHAEFPTLSSQGSGWGQSWSLDMGDEWEVYEEGGEPVIVEGDD